MLGRIYYISPVDLFLSFTSWVYSHKNQHYRPIMENQSVLSFPRCISQFRYTAMSPTTSCWGRKRRKKEGYIREVNFKIFLDYLGMETIGDFWRQPFAQKQLWCPDFSYPCDAFWTLTTWFLGLQSYSHSPPTVSLRPSLRLHLTSPWNVESEQLNIELFYVKHFLEFQSYGILLVP